MSWPILAISFLFIWLKVAVELFLFLILIHGSWKYDLDSFIFVDLFLGFLFQALVIIICHEISVYLNPYFPLLLLVCSNLVKLRGEFSIELFLGGQLFLQLFDGLVKYDALL